MSTGVLIQFRAARREAARGRRARRWLHGFGLAIVAVTLFLAVFGPIVAPYDPQASDPTAVLAPPSAAHPMGTDSSGKDVLSRVISAPRWDVAIGLSATAISLIFGVILGTVAGYLGDEPGVRGRISELMLRLTDVVQAFPVFILALGLVAAAGAGITNVILVVAFLNIPTFLRLTRASTLGLKKRTFIDAARVIGHSDASIIRRHIVPNSLAPALAQASVTVGWSVLLAAGLSFIGAGVPVPTPEWGSMIAAGQSSIITGQWWPVTFPGLALGVTVLGYALTGEALREWFNRRSKE
jgi:peptide/nickel transport system permease protein